MQKTILLLEDEEVLGKLYQKKLEKSGFNVIWAKTIATSKKIISEEKPGIILLDNSISGEEKSGMDLIPFIKNLLPQAKIIMLSNYSDFHLQDQALKRGADDYLVKIDNPPNKLVEYITLKYINQ